MYHVACSPLCHTVRHSLTISGHHATAEHASLIFNHARSPVDDDSCNCAGKPQPCSTETNSWGQAAIPNLPKMAPFSVRCCVFWKQQSVWQFHAFWWTDSFTGSGIYTNEGGSLHSSRRDFEDDRDMTARKGGERARE